MHILYWFWTLFVFGTVWRVFNLYHFVTPGCVLLVSLFLVLFHLTLLLLDILLVICYHTALCLGAFRIELQEALVYWRTIISIGMVVND